MEWQSITALACVLGTLAAFAFSMLRPGKGKSGCGKDCGCSMKRKP